MGIFASHKEACICWKILFFIQSSRLNTTVYIGVSRDSQLLELPFSEGCNEELTTLTDYIKTNKDYWKIEYHLRTIGK